jgi:hypothetical protein
MKRLLACASVALTLLFVSGISLHSQQVSAAQSSPQAKQPETFVRNFYRLVVARHPVSIPDKTEMKVFAPYLSKELRNKIDVALACSDDWNRQHPAPPVLKPPFDWLESGLFSGGNEKASPRLFHIERTQFEKDGSFRVYVRLTWGLREKPWIWHVAAIVVRERGRFVIDDVVYLKDEPEDIEMRLSEALADGCNGPHWIGDPDRGVN